MWAGMEAQLLGIVVRKERPELEEQKGMLVRNIAGGKKKIQQLEDEILRSVFIIYVYDTVMQQSARKSSSCYLHLNFFYTIRCII